MRRRSLGSGRRRVGLETGQEGIEPGVALVPVVLVADEPGRGLAEALPFQVAQPRGLASAPGDQPCPLQHLEVPRDRRLRHRERTSELADGQVAAVGQPGEDRPTGRIGQGAEDGAELVWLHLHNHYVIEQRGD